MLQKPIGERLKEERERRNMTQKDVSKILGVSKTLVSFFENGILRFPSHKVLYKISEFLCEDFLALINSEIAWMQDEIDEIEWQDEYDQCARFR